MKSLDKNKSNDPVKRILKKSPSTGKPKELDWRDKIDWVDDWLEIDCQVIFGEKGKKTLIKFIEYLLTQQRTELLEEIKHTKTLIAVADGTKYFEVMSIGNIIVKPIKDIGRGVGYKQVIFDEAIDINLLNKKDE